MIPDTATPFEIVYTSLMSLALGTCIWNLLWAHRRVVELKESGGDGPVKVLRHGAREDQAKLAGISTCLVTIGVNSLLTPSNPSVSVTTMAISAGAFLILSALVLWLSVNMRLRPRRLRIAAEGKSELDEYEHT